VDLDTITSLTALADAGRVRVAGLLADGTPRTAGAIAAALAMPQGEVVHHLRRLADAGLASVDASQAATWTIRIGRFAELGRALAAAAAAADEPGLVLPGPDGSLLSAAEAKVLRAFVQPDGRLERIPAQERKRQTVMRFIARTDFRPGEALSEKEVNQRLALRHMDVSALRRYLVDSRYLERPGGVYRLRPESDWPAPEADPPYRSTAVDRPDPA
jgi:hypothetical protein